MDGSAKIFLEELNKTQIKELDVKRKYLKVRDKVEFIDGDKKISIEPNENSLEVDFQLNYENQIIGRQRNSINLSNDKLEDIYNSRTFCLFEDIEKIKKAGLAKGGSLENAIVVNDSEVINEGGLRNSNEFVNHKILDLIGDFLLSGYRILGRVKCYQGGHELTNKFLRKMFKSKAFIRTIKLENPKAINNFKNKQLTKLVVNA